MFRSARLSSPMLLALTSALLVGQVARADDPPAQTQTQTAATLQEVVVTAQKRRETVHNVPMGVTAITSADLQSMHLSRTSRPRSLASRSSWRPRASTA
jgi:outer membrane cobalamin receptor